MEFGGFGELLLGAVLEPDVPVPEESPVELEFVAFAAPAALAAEVAPLEVFELAKVPLEALVEFVGLAVFCVALIKTGELTILKELASELTLLVELML